MCTGYDRLLTDTKERTDTKITYQFEHDVTSCYFQCSGESNPETCLYSWETAAPLETWFNLHIRFSRHCQNIFHLILKNKWYKYIISEKWRLHLSEGSWHCLHASLTVRYCFATPSSFVNHVAALCNSFQ